MRALATAAPRCTRPLRNGGSPFVRVRARIGATQAALAHGSLVLSLAVLETGGWPAAVSTAG
jgi:hypothetical protein